MAKPTLALSMIVRDAAATLADCLASVKGVVDEIVIADTGSTDDTVRIAEECGARIIHIFWEDDFAAARNQALDEVTSDWVLSLDADEVLDPEAGEKIAALLESSKADGYQVTIRNYVLSLDDRIWDRPAKPNDGRLASAQKYPAFVEHENVRLFRRHSEIRFSGRVHESVGPSIEESSLALGRAPFLIHHFGLAADIETRARKNTFYRELGRQKIIEMPENAQAHLELGLVELDNFGNFPEALTLFTRATELNPRFGVAWFFRGVAHAKLGEHAEALRAFERALKQGHRTAFLFEMMGDASYNLRKYVDALRSYEQALDLASDSPLVESKLGLAQVRAGRTEEGLETLRKAVDSQPSHPEIHDRLILSLAWLKREADAALAAEEKLKAVQQPAPSDFLRAAVLWTISKQAPRAAAVLHVGSLVYPQNEALRSALEELSADASAGVQEVLERLTVQVGTSD